MSGRLQILVAAVLAAIFLLSGYMLGRKTYRTLEPERIVQTDTLRITDTLLVENPVPAEERVVDTMFVVVADTVTVNDTVYLSLPRETKLYSDSTYTAQVSGYGPELDWIQVYPQTVYLTKVVKTQDVKRWGIGLQAGYGAYVTGGTVRLSPYLGIGISWDIVRW